jgi:predicted DNA-binding transcriptional regulator YafY
MQAHERRDALMGWLRGRPSGTAAQASERFGVTERTILRDVAALRARGEPISSCPGPGGGFQLDGTARLPGVRLTVEEVLGLALAASMSGQLTLGLPYAQAADHAIDRLIATLPRERAVRFRRLMARITVGMPAPFKPVSHPVEPGLLAALETAFAAHRVVSFTYTDRKGQVTTRAIEAHGLLLQMPVWYVIAHDRLRDAARMFRIDRMSEVRLREERFVPRPASWFAEYLDPCGCPGRAQPPV